MNGSDSRKNAYVKGYFTHAVSGLPEKSPWVVWKKPMGGLEKACGRFGKSLWTVGEKPVVLVETVGMDVW